VGAAVTGEESGYLWQTASEGGPRMKVRQSMIEYSLDHPKVIALVLFLATVGSGALIPLVKVDTDPENMLSEKEAVRVFHNAMKREFSLHDMVVLGIVNERDPDGVFNPDSLRRVYELTEFAEGLQWPDPHDPEKTVGVVEIDLLAPSKVDNIEQAGPGSVRFEWLMSEPPKTREEAREIRDKARGNPLLDGTLVSEDGQAICLYLPLTAKELSYRVYSELERKIAALQGDEKYYITGLPVAEDVFGVEMFKQMALSAPLAMLVIFLLMYAFFRKPILLVTVMIDVVASVVCTMGLLIGTGHTVHIMSSMIPIFIMPMAVLDDVHVLSEFFDRFQQTRDRRATLLKVMDELFMPMLYTTLTTAVGFASLALAPIPPVQVFGIFVAFGVVVAWLCSVMFVPAYIMLLPEKALAGFGAVEETESGTSPSALSRFLRSAGRSTYRRAKLIMLLVGVAAVVGIYGITQIRINDNPTKWFTQSHPIRVADRVLNEHFGGTYMAYLVLETESTERGTKQVAKALDEQLERLSADWPEAKPMTEKARQMVRQAAQESRSGDALLETVGQQVSKEVDDATDETIDGWEDIEGVVEAEKAAVQTFKRPEVLRYVRKLQEHLKQTDAVGKSNSVADIVRKVYKELMEGQDEYDRIPDTLPAVAQCLISYQNSHDPDDLWHLVTPDYRKASIWVQLRSGDNKDMETVTQAVERFFEANEPPVQLKPRWFGLTYINVVWQNKMVSGTLEAFLGSFLVVFVMMTILFRSPLWGALSMIPLTVTIACIYGIIGLVGKDYDMPVAVLSSLTLGLAVDFAIHFLARARAAVEEHGSWELAAGPTFGEPGRAIARNVIVVAVGFLPLLAAPLVPYKTVGVFMAAIMAVSGAATLLMLAALIRLLERRLFRVTEPASATCNCATCLIASTCSVLFVALSIRGFTGVGWTTLTWVSLAAIPVLALICGRLSRREACRRLDASEPPAAAAD